MMENYEFVETTSRGIVENGEQMRVVNFRGTDTSNRNHDKLNVDGSFTMPLMDYFKAGMEGRISEVIQTRVIERLSPVEEAPTEPTE